MARRTGQPALDRAQVVGAALKLLDEVGLDGLTLRGVAKELDVQAPALYWHVRNKRELLDEMATAMLRDLREAAVADGGTADGAPEEASWQEALAAMNRQLRRALLRHRDGAKVFAGTRLTDAGHAAAQDAYLRRLVRAGFSPGAAARAGFIAFVFTEGFVIEQQAVHPMPDERAPGYDVGERAAGIGADFPLAAEAGADLFADYDARFEEGLAAVIAGIDAMMGPRAGS